jgi:phage terminase large subunit
MIVSGMGRQVRIVEQADREDGIKLARSTFRRLWVDKEKCADWMNSLKRYRRHKSPDGTKTGEPVHDDASHGADALRYLAQIAGQLETVANSAPIKPYTAGWVR